MILLKYITDKRGKKRSIILPVKQFEELIEDLAIAAERRDEDTISHKELLKELKADGLL